MSLQCPVCAAFQHPEPITSPQDLCRAVSEIQAQLTAGRLRPVPSHRGSGGGDLPDEVAFDDLKPDNGWPDFLQHRFACRGCGAEFELTCETFHGRGGNWQRVSPER